MICFQAALWRYPAVDKATEDLARDADDALILSDTDPELDRFGAPRSSRRPRGSEKTRGASGYERVLSSRIVPIGSTARRRLQCHAGRTSMSATGNEGGGSAVH